MPNLAPIDTFRQELKLMEPNFRPLLPANIRPEKFEALVIAAVSGNPELLKANRESLWRACVQGAELGLSLNPTMGEADILIVSGGAQFRPRYKGLMKLALQSGEVTSIRSILVYENDQFEVIEGLRRDIIHKPSRGERGALTHVYCVWTLRGLAEPQFEVMDRQQVMRVKARSPSGSKGFGPWKSDEEEMWRKTVVRRASKYMPISCEAFIKAVTVDNFAEGGTEIDITSDGEIIEVHANNEFTESSQVDSIEDILPPEKPKAKTKPKVDPVQEPEVEADFEDVPTYERMDFAPSDTWQTWCVRAGAALKAMPKAHREVWAALHEDLLTEAGGQRPTLVKRIRELIDGND